MPRVFISYVHENSEPVHRLANELKAHGIQAWLDKNQIKPGFRWKDAIREGISQGDFFIACFSDEYHNRSKTYMNEELILAIEELRQRSTDRAWFIPVLLSETQVPNRDIGAGETLRSIQWVELYKNWDDGIRSILSVIQPDAAEAPEIDFPMLKEDDWSILLRHIAAGCTPFLGPAVDYGVLPYETTLAREWALKYNYPLENPLDIAKVAQFLTRIDPILPKELMRDRIKNILPPDFSEADEPHTILAELPFLIYMTTNYDDFMEQALRAQSKDPKCEFSRWNDNLRNIPSIFDDLMFEPTIESPVVFHIYGHTQVPESMVITEDDHLEFVTTFGSEHSLPLQVRRALTATSPLLLGFSLSEGKFRNLFHLLIPYFKINIYRPVIKDKAVKQYLQDYFPNLTGGSHWGTLREFMTELRSRWKKFSREDNA
jgi:hypothetical protein